MTALGLDTSVAIALLVQTHSEHAAIVRWWAGREVALCGHAVAETYSVLTRLPGYLRLAPADAALLIAERFADVACDPATLARDVALLISGGWRLENLRAFDAFPMTHHVECVATLTR